MNLFAAAKELIASCSSSGDGRYDARNEAGFYGVSDLNLPGGRVEDMRLLRECEVSRLEYPRRLVIPIVHYESSPCYGHPHKPFSYWWSKL